MIDLVAFIVAGVFLLAAFIYLAIKGERNG